MKIPKIQPIPLYLLKNEKVNYALNILIEILCEIPKINREEESFEDIEFYFNKKDSMTHVIEKKYSISYKPLDDGKYQLIKSILIKNASLGEDIFETFSSETIIFNHEYKCYNYFIDSLKNLCNLVLQKDRRNKEIEDKIINEVHLVGAYLMIISNKTLDYKNINFDDIYENLQNLELKLLRLSTEIDPDLINGCLNIEFFYRMIMEKFEGSNKITLEDLN